MKLPFLILFFLPIAVLAEQVGVILPLSGDFARYGENVREGLISGKSENLDFVFKDETCRAKEALSAYKSLKARGFRVFLGPFCGSPQKAVAPLLKSSKDLVLLGSSAPENVFQDSGERMLSVQHSIEDESRFNAEQANRLGLKTAALVFQEQEYGRTHEKAFREVFKGQILEVFAYDNPAGGVMKNIALQLEKLNPDLVYIPDAAPLLHGFLKELRQLGSQARVISTYGTQISDVFDLIKDYGDELLYSHPAIGKESPFTYFPGLAAKAISEAVGECKEVQPECIKQALLSKYSFNEQGILDGELELRTIKNGSWQKYEGK